MNILSDSSNPPSNRYPAPQRRVSSGFAGDFSFFRSGHSGAANRSSSTINSTLGGNPSHTANDSNPNVGGSENLSSQMFDLDDLLRNSSRSMANNDLDINTVLSGLDLDYSDPRRLLSNNSNSSLLNTTGHSNSSHAAGNNNANNNSISSGAESNPNTSISSANTSGLYLLNDVQARAGFKFLDFPNEATPTDAKFQRAASIGGNPNNNGFHQHSWSLASFPSVSATGSQITTPNAPLDYDPMSSIGANAAFAVHAGGNAGSVHDLMLDGANPNFERSMAGSPITVTAPSGGIANTFDSGVKSRFAHAASRSVSNPLLNSFENGNNNVSRESLGALNRPTTSSSSSSYNVNLSKNGNTGNSAVGAPVGASDLGNGFDEGRSYPLNELDPNLLLNNPKLPNAPNGPVVPLWQRHLKNRLVDGNYEHKRSWSIASFSTSPANLAGDHSKNTSLINSSIVAENVATLDSSRDNSIGSVEELATVNEIASSNMANNILENNNNTGNGVIHPSSLSVNGSLYNQGTPSTGNYVNGNYQLNRSNGVPTAARIPQSSANLNQKFSRANPLGGGYIAQNSMVYNQPLHGSHHQMNGYASTPGGTYMANVALYRSPVNHSMEQFPGPAPVPMANYNNGQFYGANGYPHFFNNNNGSNHDNGSSQSFGNGGNNRRNFSGNFSSNSINGGSNYNKINDNSNAGGSNNNSNSLSANHSNVNTGSANNSRKRGDDGARFVNASIDDFKGQIYSLCKDQHGCRFLQRQLDIYDVQKNNNKDNKSSEQSNAANANSANNRGRIENYAATIIFNEINNNIVELMTDQFGNYLIQKLLDQVTVKQRITLIKNSCLRFIKISLDSHGTRALQKLIEVITTQEENQIIIKSFENDIVSLSRDLNGNHVVQKILTKFNYKSENIQFIFNAASKNCIKISTHRHGCCVLQRCLDYGSVEQCKQLSLVIAKNCLNLAVDPFGNYVVQYVLSKGEEESIKIIVDAILSKILVLSTHKFGSNVIEKILRINNLSHVVIDEILKSSTVTAPIVTGPGSAVIGVPPPTVFLTKLLHDPYGNYVLQTVLDVADKPHQFNQLADLIKPILPSVRNTAHGRRIAAKLQATQMQQQQIQQQQLQQQVQQQVQQQIGQLEQPQQGL